MHVREPDISPQSGSLVWSKVPEFSLAYNGYSVVIPYVEYYLNAVMKRVRQQYAATNPGLGAELAVFIKQETNHSRYHIRFNQRMFDAGIEGLKPLVDRLVSDLKLQLQTKSLAFNVAYCAGFESIATYDSRYIYEQCDELFEGADPHGANLLLWHVAEEFEHRCVCHDAFRAVSGNYVTRIHGLFYAFWHVGGAFVRAEQLVLDHHIKDLPESERRESLRRSKSLFWRQLRYVAPRMLKILLPWYDPGRLRVPRRIQAALDLFRSGDPITQRIPLESAKTA
jgi:predicted metal-dependent hydrolase